MHTPLSRRDFTKALAALAATGCASQAHTPPVVFRMPRTEGGPSGERSAAALPPGTTVLFQGDSITDAGRNRNQAASNNGGALGTGYPLLIASALLAAYPDRQLRFVNRGVSGNTVPDLEARWQADAIALKPDVLSILIGVNDIWHRLAGTYNGTVADYETGYTALLEETRRALPATRFILLEPFVLRTGQVNATWFPEFDERRAIARRVAERAGAIWVPLQAALDDEAARTGPAYWLGDGVHPTPAGHALIAEHWRAAMGI